MHPAGPTWRDDLLAAAIITLLLIPQSLAYAMLAGLPPSVGLAASVLPALAYAALGSSPVTVMGPGAVLSLMCAQALGHVMSVAPAGTSVTAAALVLAAEMGGLLLLGAALRLDALVALLSVPVLHGFMTGAALTIVVTQLPVLTGARLDLAEVKGPVMDRLAAVGWSQQAHGKIYLSLHQAVGAATLSPQ
ncbi:MAG: hypothetical protein C4K60_00295 [Ideonella sp. MAG2]|nr:MAG: hypothetical protein C4K60_00295 [Ideonella sp. MAG2]